MAYVNLPVRYIEEQPAYLDLFLSQRLNPELGLDAQALETYPLSWHSEKARIFHDAGLKCAVHLPFFDLHPGSLDPLIRKATRERLLAAMETARVYEPAHFIAHLGYNHLTYSNFQDQWTQHAVETWSLLAGHASAPLFLENVFEQGPEHHVHVLSALEGRAGACLDLGHWYCFAAGARKKNLAHWLTALTPFRLHLHLHDNDGESDAHLGLGLGTIPWDQLWNELADKTITTTLEPHTETDFLATRDYLRERNLAL